MRLVMQWRGGSDRESDERPRAVQRLPTSNLSTEKIHSIPPVMSRAAKATFWGTTLLCGATVAFVHYVQKSEQAVGAHLRGARWCRGVRKRNRGRDANEPGLLSTGHACRCYPRRRTEAEQGPTRTCRRLCPAEAAGGRNVEGAVREGYDRPGAPCTSKTWKFMMRFVAYGYGGAGIDCTISRRSVSIYPRATRLFFKEPKIHEHSAYKGS